MALTFPVTEQLDVHCVVIGSGIAGLSLAVSVAEQLEERGIEPSVLVLSKSTLDNTSTRRAQGGIAAVTGKDDDFRYHIKDTLAAGRGLCDRRAVTQLVRGGPEAIRILTRCGARFDSSLGKEGGHSRRRIAHTDDSTGAEIQRALCEAACNHRAIVLKEHHFVLELLTSGSGRKRKCTGCLIINLKTGECITVQAQAVVLASGGAGHLWEHTSNQSGTTAEGIWLAYKAGAQLSDLEFVQFHPTTLDVPGAVNFLLTEALRGEGAYLLNEKGERFMAAHPQKELAPRDVVSQAIWREHESGKVFLDMRHLDAGFLRKRFPTVVAACEEHGLDPSKELVPIVPAAHYLCGGIRTGLEGRSSLPGLYAIGECACTGVHGANRLASNSLLEGTVFALTAARDIASVLQGRERKRAAGRSAPVKIALPEAEFCWELRTRLRETMWKHVGLLRDEHGLKEAAAELSAIGAEAAGAADGAPDSKSYKDLRALLEFDGMLGAAKLIVQSALLRTESRGSHQRTDYPKTSARWARHIVLENGKKPAFSRTAGLAE